MFSWVPRWHPVTWAIVIILIIAIIHDPTGWGARVSGMIHWLGYASGRLTTFATSI